MNWDPLFCIELIFPSCEVVQKPLSSSVSRLHRVPAHLDAHLWWGWIPTKYFLSAPKDSSAKEGMILNLPNPNELPPPLHYCSFWWFGGVWKHFIAINNAPSRAAAAALVFGRTKDNIWWFKKPSQAISTSSLKQKVTCSWNKVFDSGLGFFGCQNMLGVEIPGVRDRKVALGMRCRFPIRGDQ